MSLVRGVLRLAHVDELAGGSMEDVELVDKVIREHLARILDEPPDDAVQPDPKGPQLVVAASKTLNLDTISVAGGPDVLQVRPNG